MTDHDLMQAEIIELRDDVKKLREEVAELLNAWKTATGLVKFVKLLASVVTACGVLWAAMKGFKS